MPSPHFSIQPMSQTDVQRAIAWATAEGWNPGLHDAACFYAADPTGFWQGVLNGEAIATISAVKYGDDFGFIGFYIVHPAYRGQGYGLQLWQAALATLAGRNIGLDGVLAQQENYGKSGFQLAYRNIRYEGIGGGAPSQHPAIIELTQLPFEQIAAYDRQFFPSDRTTFLQHWLTQPDRTALGIWHQDRLAGYGVIRACHQGYKIGPLFADQPSFAQALFLDLKAAVRANAPVYLDSPAINPAALHLAEHYQLKPVFETARMYTQMCPALPYDRIYGVTTFELG